MPEKTELQNINKGIQNVTEELKKSNATQKKNDKKDEDEQKARLSTWGSIKSGFDAFNVSLESDENNKITWGKIGGQLKESISVWYKQTLEMDNYLGKTFRLGAAIWENVNKHIISSLKTAFSSITSGVREVLGPVAEAFDAVKNAVMGVFGFFKGMYISIFGKVKPEDKLRNKLLQGIVNYFKDEKKAEAREGDVKKKIPKPLAMLLFGLGVVVGAIVGAIMAPFRLLLGALKKLKPLTLAISKLFGEGSKFAKGIEKVKKWFAPIKALFSEGGKLAGLSKTFGKLGIFLKPLASGFKLGFRVLGWPLTILLGVIDAIKAGWAKYKEGGTVYEIIIAGIKGAFMGLLELPIKILGWVGDKILSIFGKEVEGGLADQIMKAISSIFDWIFDLPEKIIKAGKDFFGFDQTEKEKIADRQKYFGGEEKTPSQIKQALEDKKAERERWQARMDENKKIADAKEEAEKNKKIADAKKQLDETKQTNIIISQQNQTVESNQQVDQIPDEIDGSIVGLELLWDF